MRRSQSPRDWSPNVEIHSVTIGAPNHFHALWHPPRELVDLRKIEYVSKSRSVRWRSYRTSLTTTYTPEALVDAIAQYEA